MRGGNADSISVPLTCFSKVNKYPDGAPCYTCIGGIYILFLAVEHNRDSSEIVDFHSIKKFINHDSYYSSYKPV